MDDLHQPRGLFRARAPKPHPSILFLKEMLRDPLHIAAVSPSGKELARLVVRALPATDPVRVVELGGGTGSFTREMLAHRVHDEDLLVLERSPSLHDYLCESFPTVQIARGDAVDVADVARGHGFGERPPHAVVSGLPMASMRASVKMQILRGAFDLLPADGRFIQFTYGWKAPISSANLRRLGLRSRRFGTTLRNMPPATVYIFERAA